MDGKYDNNTYNNVEYHSNDGAAWGIVTGSVMLSATEGTVYGYYPYSASVSDVTAVPISATDSKDYMYATPKTGVKNSNATVDLVMNHALSVVKFSISKASTNGYTGAGAISSVKLEGATLGASGTMDITSGTVTATADELTYGTALALNGTNTGELFAVPTGVESGIKFSVVMDGQTYTATTGNVTLVQGQRYTYTLNMSSTGLTVNTVTVTEWGDQTPADPIDAALKVPSYKVSITNCYSGHDDGNIEVYVNGTLQCSGNIADELEISYDLGDEIILYWTSDWPYKHLYVNSAEASGTTIIPGSKYSYTIPTEAVINTITYSVDHDSGGA